jgi:hypothetical protein
VAAVLAVLLLSAMIGFGLQRYLDPNLGVRVEPRAAGFLVPAGLVGEFSRLAS